MTTVSFGTEKEWLAWRMTGLGGSDATIIAGVSRFKRPFELYLEKIGKRKPSAKTPAMLHGQSLEAKARDAYTLETAAFMPPANVANDETPWLHASLDGYDPDNQLILEVKCPWDIGSFLSAKEGRVPDEYWPQVQHALAASGAQRADFWCYFNEQGVLLKVDFDPAYWHDELFPAEKRFWSYVTNRDYPLPKGKEERSDPAWLEVEEQVYNALAMKQIAEERLRVAQAKMERMATKEVTKGRLLEASWVYTKPGFVPAHSRSESLSFRIRRTK